MTPATARILKTFVVCAAAFLIFSVFAASAEISLPKNGLQGWELVGRGNVQTGTNSVTVDGGCLVSKEQLSDSEISFRARAPVSTSQVQIWGGFRVRDRDSKYVFALRGGNDNDLYLARYAPDGGIRFLGFAPLDFKPEVGTWYQMRVVSSGGRIQLYLGTETLPRISVLDTNAGWTSGGICLGGGWLPVEFADLQAHALSKEKRAAIAAMGGTVWEAPPVDKEALRAEQRSAYAPVRVASLDSLRNEISLNGNWLFLPGYEAKEDATPAALNFDDARWHVMAVPSFWAPGLSWLHGEAGFPDLTGNSRTKGVADSLYVREVARCDGYTFDWRNTKSAWYREYIELPDQTAARHFELVFDAVAKVSEIWVNGIKVGAHTGMFGQIACDVTAAIKPGRNVVAVHVSGEPDKTDEQVEAVAVTVNVTSAMLHSLPHGMLQADADGIWQPVRLVVTREVFVNDCVVRSGLSGADVDVAIQNASKTDASVGITYSISSVQDGSVLYTNSVTAPLVVAAGVTNVAKLVVSGVKPKLWSPAGPNLYVLQIWLSDGNRTIDTSRTRFGFRTFTVDDSRFLLNGHSWWLRGANPFPNTLAPNDPEVAHRFMKLAHDGNVAVTRSHIVPYTSTWLDAADEEGVAVSFEGTWPWLMLKGPPPDESLLKVWKEEYLSLMHEYQNHPSLILWTVNNEMKFSVLETNRNVLQRKWYILDDMIKAMRRLDPTRPVVADSSYVRKQSLRGYESTVLPNHYDDGDVDDVHSYYGWYGPDFFHLFNGELGKNFSTPGRPLISQEMSTGYPNNDDGHPTRFYLFKNYTPQALVGDEAYENADPAIFLERQALMTKELAEAIRRTGREDVAGILHFAYFTWFARPWSVKEMAPQAGYYALKTALQPVLVSAELFGRHYFAGTTLEPRVYVVNDAEDFADLSASRLTWEIVTEGSVIASGQAEVPAVKYYQNQWLNLRVTLPEVLPAPRVDAKLVLRLEVGDRTVSTNEYDVVVASREWADGGPASEKNFTANSQMVGRGTSPHDGGTRHLTPALSPFDPSAPVKRGEGETLPASGRSPALGGSGFDAGIVTVVAPPPWLADVLPGGMRVSRGLDEALTNSGPVIVGDLEEVLKDPGQASKLRQVLARGGTVLFLHPGAALAKLFPNQVKVFKPKDGEIVTMHAPESPVFSGIEPMDLAWFDASGREIPTACTGVYELAAGSSATALAEQLDLHGNLQRTSDITKFGGTPLVEFQAGKSRVIASEMRLEAAVNDPIARRLLANLVDYACPADSR